MSKVETSEHYKRYVDNIKTGDIVVFSATKIKDISSFFSYIVRLFTMSEYNHIGVVWVTNGRHFVIEAQIPEVKITPLKNMGEFYHIPMDLIVNEEHLELLFEKIGEPYSMFEAVRAYFKKNNTDNHNWICVELIDYFLFIMDVKIGKIYTPSDVVRKLIQQFNKQLVYVQN